MNKIYAYICSKKQRMAEQLKHILEYATSQGYKANVVKPILGGLVISILIIISGLYFHSNMIAVFGIILSTIFAIAFFVAYFFCLIKDPNLLRSERFNLEKAAIEKATLKGDSTIYGHLKAPNSDYLLIEGENSPEPSLSNKEIG